MDTVAIIPARGGSKRIPRKNLTSFHGRPLVAWSITTALESDLFDRVIVSTEDDEVAVVAKKYGAEVPFRRPDRLADDHTPTADVLVHALRAAGASKGAGPTVACCIYPTAPLMIASDLARGRQALLEDPEAVSAASVTTYPAPILRALRVDEQGRLSFQWPEHELTRSNDLPEAYHDAGQFYWIRVAPFLKNPRLLGPRTVAVVIPRERVQDIDTPEDFRRAEMMFACRT